MVHHHIRQAAFKRPPQIIRQSGFAHRLRVDQHINRLRRGDSRFFAGDAEFDLAALPSGTYLIDVETAAGRETRRFVVAR